MTLTENMRATIAAGFVLALVAGPAAAQLVNENLLVGMPAGYKVGFNDKNERRIMTEMVPAGETVEAWTEMLTVQIFFRLKVTPAQFRTRMTELWAKSCPNAQTKSLGEAAENGYPSGLWLSACPRNPATGKPENTWFKAVQGQDSFYIVQKAFKFEPSREQTDTWMEFLRQVSVCDSRAPSHPCPALTKQ